MYLKQVIIYKNKLSKKQEKQLKKLLNFNTIKINGHIMIRTDMDIEYKPLKLKIKEIMNCDDGNICLTYKSF